MKPPNSKSAHMVGQRKLRLREKEMDGILWGIGLYIFYVIILWVIAYGHQSRDMYWTTHTVKNALYEGKYGLGKVSFVVQILDYLIIRLIGVDRLALIQEQSSLVLHTNTVHD